MKLKLLTLISIIGLASTTPIAANTFNPSNVSTFNANNDENRLEVECRLAELKSINKSCDRLFTFTDLGYSPCYHYSNINTMISVETANNPDVKDGKVEAKDSFTVSNKSTKYEKYYRFESNNIEKSNITSFGNATKYQLNVVVPANTKEYKVQIVAKCRVKNSIDCFKWDSSTIKYMRLWYRQRTFMQGNLSKLSTDPSEILMPVMGTIEKNCEYRAKVVNKIIRQDSFLEDYFQQPAKLQLEPYIEATLTNEITLSNEKNEPDWIPIFFWYGFFGGGYTSVGAASCINCSEVWFSANHIA